MSMNPAAGRGLILAAPSSGSGKTLVTAGLLRLLRDRAALVAGFARHGPEVPFAGMIFNRVTGPRHRAILEAAIARHLPEIACLGAVMQDPQLVLPERHLGLVPAGEHGRAETIIAGAAR